MTEMDAWSSFKINCMWNGGNEKFRLFLEPYDLLSQNTKTSPSLLPYRTVAAAFYRRWLMAQALQMEFTETAPSYEEGRK